MGKPQPIFDEDEVAAVAADAEAAAELDAGQAIPHVAMKAWLKTWGDPTESAE